MPVQYAAGSHAKYIACFEASRGVMPASGYKYVDIVSDTLGTDNPLTDRFIAGRGRNPSDPIDASNETVNGNLITALSVTGMGFWLKGLLGAPQSTQVKARGVLTFSAQPVATSTITLNGTVWTFVASGAAGPQTNIGASLAATLTALAGDLNGSADAEVAKCTYTAGATTLTIERDVAGTAGNTYTIAASANSNATTPAGTLTGGGYEHKFMSGATQLETFTLERGYPNLETPYFKRFAGVALNTLALAIQQEGVPDVTMESFCSEETDAGVTLDSTPDDANEIYFTQKDAYITVNDGVPAGLMAGGLNFSNNLEPLFLVGSSRMVEATPTNVACTGTATLRLSSAATLRNIAKARDPVPQRFGFLIKTKGWKFEIYTPRTRFQVPRETMEGPGGIDTEYQWSIGTDRTTDEAVVAYLVNDTASYA